MPQLKEFLPESVKDYLKLIAAKLRYRGAFIGSPLVGRDVSIGRGCSISRGVELGPNVRLGDYSYVNCGAIVASGEIGRFCSVGPYTLIGMPEHPLSYLSTSPRLYSRHNVFGTPSEWNDFMRPPSIGCDVWIGAHAFIRQGVRIGHGAVIAAGAVVTHDVAPYEIAGGMPARHIRYRFDPDTIAGLLREQWWERDPAELAKTPGRFQTPAAEWGIAHHQARTAEHAA